MSESTPNPFATLDRIVAELWLREDPKVRMKLWGKAQIELMRHNVDASKIARIVNANDVDALKELIEQVRFRPVDETGYPSASDGRTIGELRKAKAAEGGFDSLDNENLKRAMRAFRRKLKSIRRDDESKLGAKFVTSGRSSAIKAITPPSDFPSPVWAKLVEEGRLVRGGQGTFELPKE